MLTKIDLARHLNTVGPAHGRQAHRAEENAVGLANTIEGGGRERMAAAQEFTGADGVFDKIEADVGEPGSDGAENAHALRPLRTLRANFRWPDY